MVPRPLHYYLPVGFDYDAELQTPSFRNPADVPFKMKPPVLADRPKEEQLEPIQLVMGMAHLLSSVFWKGRSRTMLLN